MPITVQHKQTPIDIAIQKYGTVEKLFALATANKMSITKDLVAGEILITDELKITAREKRVSEILNLKQHIPASGESTDGGIVLPLGGIGYMQIGTTFKVS